MNFSEDPSSPAAPFSGDKSGQIFDLPDMVSGSPTTSERVLDTQSGFLVVVKKMGDELSLYIKRRLGTPPSSFVALTPDESVKLSKILGSSFSAESLSEEALNRTSKRRRAASKLFGGINTENESSESESDTQETAEIVENKDLILPGQKASSVHLPMKLMLSSVLRAFMIPIVGIGLAIFAFGIGAGFGTAGLIQKPTPVAVPAADVLSEQNVDSFVREFISQMLDFSPSGYRKSQIQAMSHMSDELLEKYWQETKFPLTKKQLKALNGSTVELLELTQKRTSPETTVVDIKAMLETGKKQRMPVQLRLGLGLNTKGQIVVLSQEDLSSENSGSLAGSR